MPAERVVFGVPGAGKTTFSTQLAKGWVDGGASPEEIAYLAFTKAAAKAAAQKILEVEDDQELASRFPNFRTIHSLAYKGLRKARPDVRLVTTGDMKLFAKIASMDGAYSVYDWEDLAEVMQKMKSGGRTEWDEALGAYHMTRLQARSPEDLARARKEPCERALVMLGLENLLLGTYEAFVRKYEQFKADEGLIDFTDMLEFALVEMEPLDCRYFIVDECLPAGTKILLEGGNSTTVENVRVGDRVLGYDHSTRTAQKATVVERRKRRASHHVRVNGRLTLTRNHPVFVIGRGYVEAGQLAIGDRIIVASHVPHVRKSGASAAKVLLPTGYRLRLEVHPVRSLQEIQADVDVYNIGTTTENYFAEGVLVHNCQDLCPLHDAIITKLSSNSNEIFWVGDDLQAIYGWSGASADLFLDRVRKADYRIVLRQTHRYGQEIVDLSARIADRIQNKYPKEVLPVPGRGGRVTFSGEFKPVGGDVLVLHRLVSGCAALGHAYMEAGIPFRNERGVDPLGAHAQVLAWQALDRLAEGQAVSMTAAGRLIEELMPSMVVREGAKVRLVVHGAKSKLDAPEKGAHVNLWDLVRGGLLTAEGAHVIQERGYRELRHAENLEYFDRVVRNGFALDGGGKVARITTIHGAKGREAQEVVVFNEMTQKCWDNPDAEHRLAYVAATRTKADLTVCLEKKAQWAKDQYDYPIEAD